MVIAFVTTQSLEGSTVIGRITPLARELARTHTIHLLLHKEANSVIPEFPTTPQSLQYHETGENPFIRTPEGKERYQGLQLIVTMASNVVKAYFKLLRIRPQIVVLVKSLPESVLIGSLWKLTHPRSRIFLDVDDFELTANKLTSLAQRAAIHWAERVGTTIAQAITAASPFLVDHFTQLTKQSKTVTLLPTGISAIHVTTPASQQPPTDTIPLLYIGSISRTSGHRVDLLPSILAELIQKDTRYHLAIAGSGDDIPALKVAFANQQLDTYVTWHGRFSLEKIAHLLTTHTILVDPIDSSIAQRAKSSSRVALAAAMGLACVTSNVGIRPYFVPDNLQDRFFAKPADAKDYANKIHDLHQHPLTSTEQAQLKNQAKKYEWEPLAQQYEALLTSKAT